MTRRTESNSFTGINRVDYCYPLDCLVSSPLLSSIFKLAVHSVAVFAAEIILAKIARTLPPCSRQIIDAVSELGASQDFGYPPWSFKQAEKLLTIKDR